MQEGSKQVSTWGRRDRFEQISTWSAWVVAGISIIISLLDLIGVWSGIPFLAGRLPTITLLVLGIVAGYLALERRSKLDKIDEIERQVKQGFINTQDALQEALISLRSHQGQARVTILKDVKEVYEYYARRITEAQQRIDDLTWGSMKTPERTPAVAQAVQKYLTSIVTASSRENMEYREVMTFPKDGVRFKRAEEMLARNIYGYNLKYYDIDHVNTPPLMQFLVVDGEEVVIAHYRGIYNRGGGETYLAIRHKVIVELFQDYFNAIWEGGQAIKEAGNPIHSAVLQKIKERLEKQ